MQRSDEAMICTGNFTQKNYIHVFFIVKPTNFVVFAFTYVSVSPALL
jgi:hypothetical protein